MELSNLSGFGKTRLAYLNNAGIFSCSELLDYFPKKYYNFLAPSPFIKDNTYKMIKGVLLEPAKLARIRKNFTITTAKFKDSFGNDFSAIWYNQPYVKNALSEGKEYYIYGKDDQKKKNSIVATYFKSVEKTDGLGLFPVYKPIENIPSEIIRKAMAEVLDKETIQSCLSLKVQEKFELWDLNSAYRCMHLPTNLLDLTSAKERILLERLLPIVYASDSRVKLGRNVRVHKFKNLSEIFEEYKTFLPFTLTDSQNQAINEIINDLSSDMNMNRLLEGDVGSGKTAVAFFCLYAAYKNGKQSVLLAPTEILAFEHYKLALEVFKNVFGLNIVYMSSSLSSKEKKDAIFNIKTGNADIIIGSHSVFSNLVEYKNLGLVVIDEQHKFGVKARAALQDKGKNVDTLTMSATPIPRSLKLVFEGSLDISVLKARPHKANIHTNLVGESKVDDMWNFVNKKLQSGSKVFVVCPKIEEGDESTDSSAKAIYEELKNKLNAKVALVHGKMDRVESEKLFSDFKNSEVNVLVSTSIIEVGVDAKDSDIMIIMDSINFGLASLHQLRGRVGRDGRESFCFCVVPNSAQPKSIERLKFFKNNMDGFKIAEYDLESRGAGNINGTEQHGIESSEIMGYSIELFEKAKQIVSYIKNIGETISVDYEKYNEIISSISGNIAMN